MTPNGHDRLTETHAKLIESITALTSGEEWQQMLDLARRFHSYSSSNVLLILAQCPEASRIAGYRKWQELGRQVRAGEKGIAILAPCMYRTPRDEEQKEGVPSAQQPVVRGFRVAHVFDVAQTEGVELPDVRPALLESDAPQWLWNQLAAQLTEQGFQLLRADCRPANGTTHYLARTVVVRPDLAPAQAVKTLAHELAHTLLHDGSEYADGSREVVETEAESVAYLVCSAAGINTDGYSFPYIARWSNGDLEVIRKTADRVITCARAIVTATGLAEENGHPAS